MLFKNLFCIASSIDDWKLLMMCYGCLKYKDAQQVLFSIFLQ